MDHAHHHEHHGAKPITSKRMALSATIHCLIGCFIGEMIGITIGTHLGFDMHYTVGLGILLAFVSGYAVSTWPLLRAKVPFFKALRLVFAADTLSILSMVIADSILMSTLPGAMEKDMTQPIYWVSRSLALVVAFIVAFPVNVYLLKRGKGHALTHEFHHK